MKSCSPAVRLFSQLRISSLRMPSVVLCVLQVPLLSIYGGATAAPGSLLSRLLPLEVASQLPSDFLQVRFSLVFNLSRLNIHETCLP